MPRGSRDRTLFTLACGTPASVVSSRTVIRVSFDDHVNAALDSLPPDLAAGLDNVAIVIEDEHPEDPDLFGLYEGVPLTERGDMSGALPDRITIFRIPLTEEFPDPEDLEREIRITVLHELGHYFGLDEDRLAELGYE